MRHVLTATAAGLLVLISAASAPAQQYGGRYSGSGYNSAPHVYRSQPSYPAYPSTTYAQPQYGASFGYATPSVGFGLAYSPAYGPSFSIYSQPAYAPNYYPIRSVTPYHGHHHHHHHDHHDHHGHHGHHHHHGHR